MSNLTSRKNEKKIYPSFNELTNEFFLEKRSRVLHRSGCGGRQLEGAKGLKHSRRCGAVSKLVRNLGGVGGQRFCFRRLESNWL